eukprot:7151426-Prymnesium_polylepis.3
MREPIVRHTACHKFQVLILIPPMGHIGCSTTKEANYRHLLALLKVIAVIAPRASVDESSRIVV